MEISKKKILVTGINDLVGMTLISVLRNLGAKLVGLGDLHEDLGSLNYLENEILRFQPEIIFHVPGHRYGIAVHHNNPGDVYYESTIIFAHLLEAARKAGVSKIINVLSNCVYPEEIEIPYKEENIWLGLPEKTLIPHGMARRMSIIHGNAYWHQHGLKTISVVLASVYGPNDNFDESTSQVFASMIRRFMVAERNNLSEVVCWGSGNPTREFIHVRDAVLGLILSAKHYDEELPLNIGSQNEISIKELTELIANKCKYSGKILWDMTKPDGRPRVCLDSSRMKSLLPKWKMTSYEDGICETVNWFKDSLTQI